jgi:hypothetical protein
MMHETPTEEHLARLAELLETEADVYEETLEIAGVVRRRLVERDVESLRATITRKEALIARVDAIEGERREIVAAVTERLTGRGRPMTISEIVAAVRAPERERLEGLRERILAQIGRIQRLSETNAYLVGSSLEAIGAELALLTEGEGHGVTSRPASLSLMDSQRPRTTGGSR